MIGDPFLIAVGILDGRDLTEEVLEEIIGLLPKVLPKIDDATLERVRRLLESNIGISMRTGEGLRSDEQQPWLEEVKSSIRWNYWDSYVMQLRASGLGSPVIRTLDEDTDNILNECGNPAEEAGWRVRGLVMGDVQSGKTANYCGLIAKAADAGYKIIVLLTGMIEELRAQSQERLDEGFVGRDSRKLIAGESSGTPIGAGRFRTLIPNVLTSIDFDFLTSNNRTLGGIPLQNIQQPVLLVMKKNSSPLQNLIGYLDTQRKIAKTDKVTLPLLLIDDEADNASVNSKKDEDPATINKLIRELIGLFDKSTYTAYTATPFANVFINPDKNDLFPENFVYSLNAPNNYIGASSIFVDPGEHTEQLVDIDDACDFFPEKHDKSLEIESLPQSLQNAVGTFLLSCAIRDIREEPLRHRTMLVNVTRFTDVQDRLATAIKNYLFELTEEIKQYIADDDLWQNHASLRQLHALFLEHYTSSSTSWQKARRRLYDSIASVKVLTINQKSEKSDRLNYSAYKNTEKGRRVIAVGGLTLSRGLTLEGLCVSYFYRNSKAYDTLLQMGRWFGYRPGYSDLCRIWMDPDVQGWFSHIASVIGELRADIRRMHVNKQPPRNFGIRVRSHPDVLMVTAANKMRNAQEVKIEVSFSGYGTETPFLPKSHELNSSNLNKVRDFTKELGQASLNKGRCLWSNVEPIQIVSFLRNLEISTMNMAFVPDMSGDERPLIKFIRDNSIPSLRHWDVCLAQGEGSLIDDLQILCADGTYMNVQARRRQFEKTTSEFTEYLKVNKHRVGEIGDEKVGMSGEEIQAAEHFWSEEVKNDPDKSGKTIPGWAYRHTRAKPLLTIHLIQPVNPENPNSKSAIRIMDADRIESKVLVAVSLSFPKFSENSATYVPYKLNKVALRNIGLLDEENYDNDQD